MRGTALVVAADTTTQMAWEQLVARRGFRPLVTGSPAQAEILIEDAAPCLAIVDWQAQTGRFSTTAELLATLAEFHPEAITVVCDAAVGDLAVAGAVVAAHPGALLQDSRLGEGSLGARLDRLLGRGVGDLCIRQGVLCHSPSGDLLPNDVGLRLLLAYPAAVEIDRTSGGRMALLRLRRWLESHGSCVHVTAHRGISLYGMRVVQAEVPAAAAAA
jgi:hypothetical protein